MVPLSYPLRFILVAIAGWIHQRQREVIDYLQEENRVLREQIGPRRLRFSNDQRIRLAAKAKTLAIMFTQSFEPLRARRGQNAISSRVDPTWVLGSRQSVKSWRERRADVTTVGFLCEEGFDPLRTKQCVCT